MSSGMHRRVFPSLFRGRGRWLPFWLLFWLLASPTLPLSVAQTPPPQKPTPPAPPPGPPQTPPQKYCPVMTSEEVDPETSPQVMYEGVTIYLCCDQCVSKFRRDPAAYLDPAIVPALRGKKLPPRGLEQVYCPVLRDRKVSAKDPFTIYQGVKVYFYNDLARQRFEKDPQRYADPAILPQLKKVKPQP